MAMLLIFGKVAWGQTTYYIDPVSGNDLHTGTSGTFTGGDNGPWKTLKRANLFHFTAPNSTLLLKANVNHIGCLIIQSDDTGLIRIGSYGGNTPEDKAKIIGNTNSTNVGVVFESCDYNVNPPACTPTHPPAVVAIIDKGGLTTENLDIDGSNITENMPGICYTANWLESFDAIDHCAWVENNAILNVSSHDFMGGEKAAGIRIEANVFTCTDNNIYNEDGGLDGFIIDGCEVYNNINGIIVVGKVNAATNAYSNKNFQIRNCNAHDNPGGNFSVVTGSGIYVGAINGCIIENCHAANNGSTAYSGSGPAGIWASEANNVTIQFCESNNNHSMNTTIDGGGFDFDNGVSNSVMQYNYSHDNDAYGFLLNQHHSDYITSNSNNTIRYNISVNDGNELKTQSASGGWQSAYGAIHIYCSATQPVTGANIYNNTVYYTANLDFSPDGNGLMPKTPSAPFKMDAENGHYTNITNINVFNNIFYTVNSPYVIAVGKDAGISFYKNDFYYTNGGTPLFAQAFSFWEDNYTNDGITNTTPWFQNAPDVNYLSNDNNLTIDPLLVAPGMGADGHRLQMNSPMIDAGTNSFGNLGDRDFFGTTPIPINEHYDIGAHEFKCEVEPFTVVLSSNTVCPGTSFNITANIPAGLNASNYKVFFVNTDGSITFITSGSTPTLTVNGINTASTLQMCAEIAGCATVFSQTTDINVFPTTTVPLALSIEDCDNDGQNTAETVRLTATAPSGYTGTYRWFKVNGSGSGFAVTNQNFITIPLTDNDNNPDNHGVGTYVVRITDANGCDAIGTIQVLTNQFPIHIRGNVNNIQNYDNNPSTPNNPAPPVVTNRIVYVKCLITLLSNNTTNTALNNVWNISNATFVFQDEQDGIDLRRDRVALLAANSTFRSNQCNGGVWRGFRVQGNPNVSMVNATNLSTDTPGLGHGILRLNNCTVQDAITGVQLGYESATSPSGNAGGFLRAIGSTRFVNCARGVYFFPHLVSFKQASVIDGSYFTFNNIYQGASTHLNNMFEIGAQGVGIEVGVENIVRNVRNNSFIKSGSLLPAWYGIGIWATGAGLIAEGNHFSKCVGGIWVFGDHDPIHNATIRNNNVFSNVYQGISLVFCDFSSIENNYFEQIPLQGIAGYTPLGAATSNSGQLRITDNTFDADNSNFDQRVGLSISQTHSKQSSTVNCNHFTGSFHTATRFAGDNPQVFADYNSYTEPNNYDWLIDGNLENQGQCEDVIKIVRHNAFHPEQPDCNAAAVHILSNDPDFEYYYPEVDPTTQSDALMFVPCEGGMGCKVQDEPIEDCQVSNIDENPCEGAEHWIDCVTALMAGLDERERQAMYYVLMKQRLDAEEMTALKALLYLKDDERSYKSLTSIHINEGDLNKAQENLDKITADTDEDLQFKTIYQAVIDMGGWVYVEEEDTTGSGKQAAAQAQLRTLAEQNPYRGSPTLAQQAAAFGKRQSFPLHFALPLAAAEPAQQQPNTAAIAPNPADVEAWITLPQLQKWYLYDLNGRLLLQQAQNSVPTAHLPAGLYMLQIYDKQGNIFTHQLNVVHP